MIFLIYTILAILQQNKGMISEVPNPCLSTVVESIVVDMCESNSATEEINSGSFTVDSVVLRIMTQRKNCICRVTFDNQIQPIAVGLRKYNGLITSSPEESACGLAIDINHIPNSSAVNAIAPIACVKNVDLRYVSLLQNSTLQFKSRIINGNFTRGYCIRIRRDSNSDSSQVLRIDCDAPVTTEPTTEMSTTVPTTDNFTMVKHQQTASTTDPTTGNEETTYIAIGAGSGVALILLVVLVVICLRRKSTQKAGTNENVNKSYQEEESHDQLQDNVLYVPAEEFDINGGIYSTADMDTARSSNETLSEEGNYSTVNEDTPKSSNTTITMDGNYSFVDLDEHLETNSSYPDNSRLGQTKGKPITTKKAKPKSSCIKSEGNSSSDQIIKHISPPNGSDNVYAVVDKSIKHVHTTDGGKGEGLCQPDQTYAVVDKARKLKSSPDETNKKKFEINYGNKF